MITFKHFSLFTTNVDTLALNNLPANISFDDYSFSIHYDKLKFFISSNRQFFINSHQSTFAEIRRGDLINFDHEFILFTDSKDFIGNNVFVGKIRINGIVGRLLIFRLSRKSIAKDYSDIIEIMTRLPEAEKIFIDASATQFMDSLAIKNMIALIHQISLSNRSLFFYKPSPKFITYLKLANIEKTVPLMLSSNKHIDHFIKKRVANMQQHSGATLFFISDNNNRVTVMPETVLPVGRLNMNYGLLLFDDQISRVHLLFINTDNSLYLIDCNSTNSSYINGMRVAPYCLHHLKDKDMVTIGHNSHFIINRMCP